MNVFKKTGSRKSNIIRHCEQSEAIQEKMDSGLLRFARNDGKNKKVFIYILVLCFVLSFASCGETSQTGQVIYFESDSSFNILDPQLATTLSEKTITANCFEGLFRIDEDGGVQNAAVQSYTVSDDELLYTFYIKQNLLWSDETPVISDDFIFGLTRAVSPLVKSPDASLLFSIENAKNYHDGVVGETDVGIKKIDNYTFSIKLSQKDKNLLAALAEPACMPCNSDFLFSTNGRYGKDGDLVLSNGPFRIKRWDFETKSIRLVKNEKYNGNFKAKPSAVVLKFNFDCDEIFNNIKNNNSDIIFLRSETFYNRDVSSFNVFEIFNTTYTLYVNLKINKTDNAKIREALLRSVDKQTISINIPDIYRTTNSVIPSSINKELTNKRIEINNIPTNKYDVSVAKNIFNSQIKTKDFPYKELLYVNIPELKQIANNIVHGFEATFGIVINTKEINETELFALAKSDNALLAIIPFHGSDKNSLDYLKRFKSDSTDNFVSIKNNSFDAAINNVDFADSYILKQIEAENILLNTNHFFPLFDTGICFVSQKTIIGMYYVNNGSYINFINSVKNG